MLSGCLHNGPQPGMWQAVFELCTLEPERGSILGVTLGPADSMPVGEAPCLDSPSLLFAS